MYYTAILNHPAALLPEPESLESPDATTDSEVPDYQLRMIVLKEMEYSGQ